MVPQNACNAAHNDRSGAPYHPLSRRPEMDATIMGDVVEHVITAGISLRDDHQS